jgi:hypothetical protein
MTAELRESNASMSPRWSTVKSFWSSSDSYSSQVDAQNRSAKTVDVLVDATDQTVGLDMAMNIAMG